MYYFIGFYFGNGIHSNYSQSLMGIRLRSTSALSLLNMLKKAGVNNITLRIDNTPGLISVFKAAVFATVRWLVYDKYSATIINSIGGTSSNITGCDMDKLNNFFQLSPSPPLYTATSPIPTSISKSSYHPSNQDSLSNINPSKNKITNYFTPSSPSKQASSPLNQLLPSSLPLLHSSPKPSNTIYPDTKTIIEDYDEYVKYIGQSVQHFQFIQTFVVFIIEYHAADGSTSETFSEDDNYFKCKIRDITLKSRDTDFTKWTKNN
ncbi:unnamed protein product [Cunninghamella echinulata]